MNEFRKMDGLLYLQKNVRETPPTTKCTRPNVWINLGFHSKVKVWLFDLSMLHNKCDDVFTEHIASKRKVTGIASNNKMAYKIKMTSKENRKLPQNSTNPKDTTIQQPLFFTNLLKNLQYIGRWCLCARLAANRLMGCL